MERNPDKELISVIRLQRINKVIHTKVCVLCCLSRFDPHPRYCGGETGKFPGNILKQHGYVLFILEEREGTVKIVGWGKKVQSHPNR